jgi:predicted MFS family arabinose efflux permease
MTRGASAMGVYLLGIGLTVVGTSIFNVLPLVTAAAADNLGFTDGQVGVLSLAITAGSGLSALFSGLWVRTFSWRRAAYLALGGMSMTTLLGMLVHQYWGIVLILGAAGACAISLLCMGLTILSDHPDSARGFGISNAMQVVYQVIAVLAGPVLMRLAGFNGVLVMLAGLSAAALLFVPILPNQGKAAASSDGSKGLLKPATLVALLAYGVSFVNAGGYWTYAELIGEAQGMTQRTVANCVAAGVAAGALGGVLAWLLGDRFGRLRPLLFGGFLTLWAAWILLGSFSVMGFVFSGALYFFAWNYVVAYQLSFVNSVDATGRAVAVMQAFAFLGAAAGAGLSAFLVTPGSYRPVMWLVVVATSVSVVLFMVSYWLHRDGSRAVTLEPQAESN